MQQTEDFKITKLIGSIIAKKRKEKKLTQAQLAEQLDITQESLSRIELGTVATKLSRLPQIAKSLDCSIPDLFRPIDETSYEHFKHIHEQITLLSAKEQKIVLNIFESVLNAFKVEKIKS